MTRRCCPIWGLLDTARYKLVLVLNAFYLDATQRRLIAATSADPRQDDRSGSMHPGISTRRAVVWRRIEQMTGIHVVADQAAGGKAVTPTSINRGTTDGLASVRRSGPDDREPLLAADPLIVVDSRATALAVRSDDPAKVVVARRRMDTWTSVYSATAPLPAALLKQLAADAGVHIYDQDPTHLLFANRRYLTIAGNDQGGPATIRLPHNTRVVDLFSGETLGVDARDFTLPLRPKEVRMFSLE